MVSSIDVASTRTAINADIAALNSEPTRAPNNPQKKTMYSVVVLSKNFNNGMNWQSGNLYDSIDLAVKSCPYGQVIGTIAVVIDLL